MKIFSEGIGMRVQDVSQLLREEARTGVDSELTEPAMMLSREHVNLHEDEIRLELQEMVRKNANWTMALVAMKNIELANKEELATIVSRADLVSIDPLTYQEEHYFITFPFKYVAPMTAQYKAWAEEYRTQAQPHYESMLHTATHPSEKDSGYNFAYAAEQFASWHVGIRNYENWSNQLSVLPFEANVPQPPAL